MSRWAWGAAMVMVALAPITAQAEPRFAPVEIAPHVYDGGWEHFVGGGVAVFDCNGDGRAEIFAAGGAGPAALFKNTSEDGVGFDRLRRPAVELTGVTGAYPLDIDSDGVMDLVVLRVGPDVFLRGQGDCEFAPFEGVGFVFGDHWTTSFSATWEAGQSLPTLAFGTYVDRTDPDGPFEACDAPLLYRPSGDSYTAPTALEPGNCALSVLFSDWGRLGRADLRISNDRHYYVKGGQEQMWAMEATPRLYGTQDNWQPFSIWGMGIASRDVTQDGLPEVYLTSMGDQKFQQFDPSMGGPAWRDVTFDYGTTAHRPHTGGDGRPSTGWHAQFGDVTNDGLDDIFVSKGNVEQMPGLAMDDPNTLLQQRPDGRFEEVAGPAGLASMARGRGAALVDLNLDGRLDLVVANRRAPLEVYENVSQGTGHWLAVTLAQSGANRFAIGSFIELRVGERLHTREVTVGGGHASGQAAPEHFGLGPHDQAEVRVIWPDGEVTPWKTVRAGQIVEISR